MKLKLQGKWISMRHKLRVVDENEKILYTVESMPLSMSDKTYIHNHVGEEIAYIHRKPISFHNRFTVEIKGMESFELSKELFRLKHIVHIPRLGWILEGDFLQHDYSLKDENGNVIASLYRKWLSLGSCFEIDVKQVQYCDQVVAIFVCLEHMQANNASVTVSTSN